MDRRAQYRPSLTTGCGRGADRTPDGKHLVFDSILYNRAPACHLHTVAVYAAFELHSMDYIADLLGDESVGPHYHQSRQD